MSLGPGPTYTCSGGSAGATRFCGSGVAPLLRQNARVVSHAHACTANEASVPSSVFQKNQCSSPATQLALRSTRARTVLMVYSQYCVCGQNCFVLCANFVDTSVVTRV